MGRSARASGSISNNRPSQSPMVIGREDIRAAAASGSGEACQRSVQNPCKMPDRIMTTKVVAIDSDRNMDFDSREVPAALAGGRLEVLVLGIRRAVDIAACPVDDDPEHPHAKRGEPLVAGVDLG